MLSDKASILNELKLETITVPIGKCNVIVSELGAVDYIEANESNLVKKENGEIDYQLFKGLVAARSIVDESGNRIFKDEDCRALANSSKTKFKVLFDAIEKINMVTGEEIKNSEAGQSVSLPSDSACNLESNTQMN